MAHSAEYMREYRARRKEEGRPVPSGPPPRVRIRVGRKYVARQIFDPEDYSHPQSDVRLGP